MSKIKYISFFKKDAVFDSERIARDLLDVCEQFDFGKDDAICKIQVIQGELVHCKDCKYWAEGGRVYNSETKSCSTVMVCDRFICEEGCGHTCLETDADDFCSRGEKK